VKRSGLVKYCLSLLLALSFGPQSTDQELLIREGQGIVARQAANKKSLIVVVRLAALPAEIRAALLNRDRSSRHIPKIEVLSGDSLLFFIAPLANPLTYLH